MSPRFIHRGLMLGSLLSSFSFNNLAAAEPAAPNPATARAETADETPATDGLPLKEIEKAYGGANPPEADINCIACDRDQLLNLIAAPACSVVMFDLTGIDDPPRGLLELLVWANEQDRDVELLNPSAAVQDMLRVANLDTFLLMRGATL